MTDQETIAELTKNCGLNASVEIIHYSGDTAALIKPVADSTENIVFSLLQPLCEEMSFTAPDVRYAMVSFGDNHTTIVDCSLYQILFRLILIP